jgi:hypothetical protein
MMKQLRNAEEVLEFYIYNVRMGTYDKKFMLNLQTSKVLMRQPITTNQAALFKKVVKKYSKQLSTYNFDVNELADLPWTLKVVESTSEFTQVHLKIIDEKLVVYTPYKAEFVKDFRSANLMIWDRNERKYICDYGIRTLKLVFDIICRHYSEINVCPEIQKILDELKIYENASYWTPTLVKSKTGIFYIAASNQALEDAMDTLALKFECYNLSKMAELGIEIPQEYMLEFEDSVNKKFLTCAISHQINWDESDFENLGKFLREINIDRIIVINGYSTNTKDYSCELDNTNIPYKLFSGIKDTVKIAKTINSLKNKNVAIIRFGKFGTAHNIGKKFVSKIINIIDNSPVVLQNETV